MSKVRGKYTLWDVPTRRRFFSWVQLSPPQYFAGTFLLVILIGALGFSVLPIYVPPDSSTPTSLNWLDSLFTATSAVCVTGLIVVDTARFTFWGQVYVLTLIQLGGLGMITFTSMIITALGGRVSLMEESVTAIGSRPTTQLDPRRLIIDVVKFTFAIEGIGAVLLYLSWLIHPVPGRTYVTALWDAVFHSISAFCNAGFSTFSASLEGSQRSPLTQLVIMALIVLGGLGFVVLEEILVWRQARKAGKVYYFSLHTRIVLSMTVLLVLGPWLPFAYFEWNNTLADLPILDKVTNSLFLSVTPRTAGFNTVKYSEATDATCFLTILMMMIGGSPGSTAGGVKTTTMALLGVVALSRLRGERTPILWNRSFREEIINRTIGLVVVAFGLAMLGILMLTFTEFHKGEQRKFLEHSFEVVSALNTVGLSMESTSGISSLGRCILIGLMFLGRIGPLTFAAALAVRYARAKRFRYAYEDVIVG